MQQQKMNELRNWLLATQKRQNEILEEKLCDISGSA